MKVRQGPCGVSDLAVELFKVLFMATMTFEESGARTLYVRVSAVLAEDRVQFLALTLGSSQTPVIPPLE